MNHRFLIPGLSEPGLFQYKQLFLHYISEPLSNVTLCPPKLSECFQGYHTEALHNGYSPRAQFHRWDMIATAGCNKCFFHVRLMFCI